MAIRRSAHRYHFRASYDFGHRTLKQIKEGPPQREEKPDTRSEHHKEKPRCFPSLSDHEIELAKEQLRKLQQKTP